MKLTIVHRGFITLCFKTNLMGNLVVLKFLLILRKGHKSCKNKTYINLNVNNTIKALIILNLILDIEDSLDYPEGKVL